VAEPDPFRALRNALLLPAGSGAPPRRIAVAAASLSGKSAPTTAGLARSIACTGARVVAIDCDLARPSLHQAFGIPNGTGLAAVLESSGPPALVVADQDEVLPAGETAPGTDALLASERLQALFDLLLEKADHIVLNAPPVVPGGEGLLVASRSDAVLLVIEAGRATRKDGREAVALLRRAGAPLVGAVLAG
jgi:succinoglycan biosynthesis transport protein ExoP